MMKKLALTTCCVMGIALFPCGAEESATENNNEKPMDTQQSINELCIQIAKNHIKNNNENIEDYTFKYHGMDNKKEYHIVDVFYKKDIEKGVPGKGSGKSVQLIIDAESKKIINTLMYQ